MKRQAVAAVFAMVFWGASYAGAELVVEDFNYTSGANMNSGLNGGTGWSGAWGTGGSSGTTSTMSIVGSNLSYSAGGYNIVQTGTGLVHGNYNGFRGMNRDIASPLTDGIGWFTVLVENDSTSDRSGIQFNNAASADYNASDYYVRLQGDTLVVNYDGTLTTVATGLAVDETHLILGRWDVSDNGNDTLSVWIDPLTLGAVGTADYTASSADLGSVGLERLGVLAYGGGGTVNYGQVDAIRFSDTATAYSDVTGAPEPATLVMLAALVPALLLARRRRRRTAAR